MGTVCQQITPLKILGIGKDLLGNMHAQNHAHAHAQNQRQGWVEMGLGMQRLWSKSSKQRRSVAGSSLKVCLWGKFPFTSSPSWITHSASKAQVVFLLLQTTPAWCEWRHSASSSYVLYILCDYKNKNLCSLLLTIYIFSSHVCSEQS